MEMSFGFSTLVDLLSWTAVTLLAIKLIATIVLLARGARRHQPLPGAYALPLWWATKITPVLAVPCLIAAALISRRAGDVWVWSAMMVFVAVMVPVMIWKRFCHRSA
jgi:hypothetical protein